MTKRKPDKIERDLDDARDRACRAFAALWLDASPEAVQEARAAGRHVDAACRRAEGAIRKAKRKR